MEVAAAVTEDRFRLLVQSVVDYAIYMLDPAGRIVSWNSGAQQIKGYAAEEVLGRSFAIFYTAADRARGLPARNLEVAAREGRYSEEAWRVRRDGSRFRALVAIDAIHGVDGELLGFAKVTRDITARWRALEQLEESERRFRLFAEGVPEYALCMLDAEGRVRHWNSGARRISGYEGEDILGASIERLFAPEEGAALARMFGEAMATGGHEADHSCMRKDGNRFLAHVALRALRDVDGVLHGFACIVKDVSEQRTIEAELEETRERLFQSRKLDALGQLTGGVAHDFNNIMQAALGGLEVARLQLARGDAPQADVYVAEAMRALERASQLTRRLLAFARRQPLMPACVELNELVGSMRDLVEQVLGGGAELSVSLHDDPLYAMCDAAQLEMVLLNLVTNARDAMPGGGRLRIAVRPAAGSDGELPGVSLIVEDDGVGMAPDMAARAFDPFFTTKPLGQGVGLGLSIVHGFAQQSRGSVHLSSVPGEGTRVELRLPACDPAEAA
jgi:PAS domain S-box-containing protein